MISVLVRVATVISVFISNQREIHGIVLHLVYSMLPFHAFQQDFDLQRVASC